MKRLQNLRIRPVENSNSPIGDSAVSQSLTKKASTAVKAALGEKKAVEGLFRPLLNQLLSGMVKQTLLVTSGLLLFSAWYLTPNLKSLLDGVFGKPETSLERAWSWVRGQMPSSVLGMADSTPGKTTVSSVNPLLGELKEQRELLEGNKKTVEDLQRELQSGQRELADRLEGVRRDQERTDQRIRGLSGASGPTWWGELLRVAVTSTISGVVGWLLGLGGDGATRGQLKTVHENLSEQAAILDSHLLASVEVNRVLASGNAQDHVGIMSVLIGITTQLNKMANRMGLWSYDLERRDFFNPEDPNQRYSPPGYGQPPAGGGGGGGPAPRGGNYGGPVVEEMVPEAPEAAANGPQEGQPQPTVGGVEAPMAAQATRVVVEDVVESVVVENVVMEEAVMVEEEREVVGAVEKVDGSGGSGLMEMVETAVVVGVGAGVLVAAPAMVPVAVPAVGGATAVGSVAGAVSVKVVATVAAVVAASTTRWLWEMVFPARPTMAMMAKVPEAAKVDAETAVKGLNSPTQPGCGDRFGKTTRVYVAPDTAEPLKQGIGETLRPFPWRKQPRSGEAPKNLSSFNGQCGSALQPGARTEGLWALTREKTFDWVNRLAGGRLKTTTPAVTTPEVVTGAGLDLGRRTAGWLELMRQRANLLAERPDAFRAFFHQKVEETLAGTGPGTGGAGRVVAKAAAKAALEKEPLPAWAQQLGLENLRTAVEGLTKTVKQVLGIGPWIWENKPGLALGLVALKATPWAMATTLALTGRASAAAGMVGGAATRWILNSEGVAPERNALAEKMVQAWDRANQELLAVASNPENAQLLEVAAELYQLR